MHKLAILALAAALSGCASLGLQDPFANGRFDSAVWKADLALIRAKIQTGGQAALDVMDALCPEISTASQVVNDPAYYAAAQTVFGPNAVNKNLNNINDGLHLLSDACQVRSAATARDVLLNGAQAINDAKRIFAAKK